MADNYKLIGKGIVAEDKNEGSRFISVYLPESLPYFEGELTDKAVKLKRTVVSSNGEKEDITIFKKATVKAEWKKENNQPVAPRVKKGEIVDVFELIDTNLYYWQVSGDNTHVRRNDRIIKTFSGSGESPEKDIPQTKENTYGFELDPAAKILRVWTSAVNGEKAAFDIDLNGKDGVLSIKAGDLIFQLNKPSDSMLIQNAAGSTILLEKNKLDVTVEEITFNATNVTYSIKNIFKLTSTIAKINASALLEASTKLLKISAVTTIFTSDNFGTETKRMDVKSNTVDVKSNSVNTKSDKIEMSGKINTIDTDTLTININTLKYVAKSLSIITSKIANVILEIFNLESKENTIKSDNWSIINTGNIQLSTYDIIYNITNSMEVTTNHYIIDAQSSFIVTSLSTATININGDITAVNVNGEYANFNHWSWTPFP